MLTLHQMEAIRRKRGFAEATSANTSAAAIKNLLTASLLCSYLHGFGFVSRFDLCFGE